MSRSTCVTYFAFELHGFLLLHRSFGCLCIGEEGVVRIDFHGHEELVVILEWCVEQRESWLLPHGIVQCGAVDAVNGDVQGTGVGFTGLRARQRIGGVRLLNVGFDQIEAFLDERFVQTLVVGDCEIGSALKELLSGSFDRVDPLLTLIGGREEYHGGVGWTRRRSWQRGVSQDQLQFRLREIVFVLLLADRFGQTGGDHLLEGDSRKMRMSNDRLHSIWGPSPILCRMTSNSTSDHLQRVVLDTSDIVTSEDLPPVLLMSSDALCGTVHCRLTIGMNQWSAYFGLQSEVVRVKGAVSVGRHYLASSFVFR